MEALLLILKVNKSVFFHTILEVAMGILSGIVPLRDCRTQYN